jgi:AcrR family transcriptional regulator
MKMREVAKQAGLNLSKYHYYFRTKEAFSKAVVESILADLRQETLAELSRRGNGAPLQELSHCLLMEAKFLRDHEAMILSLMNGAQRGDAFAQEVLKSSHVEEYIALTLGRIERCIDEGLLEETFSQVVTNMLFGAVLGGGMFFRMLAGPLNGELLRRLGIDPQETRLEDARLEFIVQKIVGSGLTEKGRRMLAAAPQGQAG